MKVGTKIQTQLLLPLRHTALPYSGRYESAVLTLNAINYLMCVLHDVYEYKECDQKLDLPAAVYGLILLLFIAVLIYTYLSSIVLSKG